MFREYIARETQSLESERGGWGEGFNRHQHRQISELSLRVPPHGSCAQIHSYSVRTSSDSCAVSALGLRERASGLPGRLPGKEPTQPRVKSED
jgi:hypothetical protein